MDAVKDKTKAIAISRSHALNNPLQLRDSIDFVCFPVQENVVIYSAVMLFKKFHHLLPMIDAKIRTIAESGLLSKWELDSLKISKKEDVLSASGSHRTGQIKLALEHVEGAFFMVIIGLAFSFVVFLMECLVHRMVTRKKNLKVLKKLENIVCYSK